MDHMVLIGSDDVRAGGHAAREAAHEMKSAAAAIESALDRHRQHMDEWLLRFEQAVDKLTLSGTGR